MILSAQSIRRRCLGYNMIKPFVERTVSPRGNSYGLSHASYDIRIDAGVVVPPNGFSLASTFEHFHIPNDLLMVVRDKSSWARRGLTVCNTQAEPGWSGYLTLELMNHSSCPILVEAYEPIAQVVFEELDDATEMPYAGKYQNQRRGPQPALKEEENLFTMGR